MGSKNNSKDKADKDSKAHQQAVSNIQANEAKEVQPKAGGIEAAFKDNYKKGAGSKYSGKLADAMANANFRQSRLGDMKKRGVLGVMDPLGRSGLPGEYNVTPGGMQDTVRGTLGYQEYGDLGRMVDRGLIAGRDMNQLKPNSLAGFANLNEQAAANRMFGFNPTKGMGILDSLRYGFTNPTSQRQFQQLGNIGKGIMNLMPGRMLGTALLNKIPGVNIPSQFAMTEPTPFNIGPGFSEFPNRFDMFSNPELEGMTENAIYSRLFNDVAPVQTGMFNPPAEQTVGQPIQSVTETTNMPGMEGIPDMFPDNQGVPTYDFDKIINGDYYEQDPRSLGSGDLPASEMGAFSNMQNTNTFNLFNPDTYPNIGGFMFGSNFGNTAPSNPSSPVFDGNSMYEGQRYDPAFDESSGISDSYMQANPNRFFNV
jgi:hypothetical protein